jgi:hypothetical protein
MDSPDGDYLELGTGEARGGATAEWMLAFLLG